MSALPNIYIIGSQSTGKTTLVNALVKHFDSHPIASTTQGQPSSSSPGVIKEVARTVLAQHNYTRADIRTSEDHALEIQRLIIEAQYDAERRHLKQSRFRQHEKTKTTHHPWFISDRSAIDPIIYARKFTNHSHASTLSTSAKFIELQTRMATSLIVLCESGVDWLVDDGVRLMPRDGKEWAEIHEEFCVVLGELGLVYHVLPAGVKDINERVRFVVAKWEEMRCPLVVARENGMNGDGEVKKEKEMMWDGVRCLDGDFDEIEAEEAMWDDTRRCLRGEEV